MGIGQGRRVAPPPEVTESKGRQIDRKINIIKKEIWFFALNKSSITEPNARKFNKWLKFF